MASINSVKHWDAEVDVLVCGFGCAGSSAAIEAYDAEPGLNLLMIEKAPQEFAGGNCRVSGQSLLFSKNKKALMDYQRIMSEANPIDEELLDDWAERMVNLEPWVQKIAADVGATFQKGSGFSGHYAVLEFPELGAKEAVEYTGTILPCPSGVWLALKANVEKRNIPVWYGTRLVDLIQDPDTLEVFGAWVEQNGVRKAIRAARGVVMAVGGFEANPQMQRDYYGLSGVVPLGTPYNTGDGVKIMQKAGAELWHLRNQGQSGGIWPGIQVPGQETAYHRNFMLPAFSWFDIDQTGRRFYNETDGLQMTHYKEKKYGRFVDVPLTFAQPVHMIFDDATRTAGKLVMEILAWSAVVVNEGWSDDNVEEVASGLIKKADTPAELAKLIGMDPDVLEAEVARYNKACETGVDEVTGRSADTLIPLSAPYYAVLITPTIVCTGGGAKRNMDGQVFDQNGGIIPRLFEAGELGSIFSDLYQNGSYLTEAMISGRGAAMSAVKMAPHDITVKAA
jgi:succinate dehydrogenase/fumarate reductase flavoprotein subunit